MRWLFALLSLALGCDSFADSSPARHDLRPTDAGVGGTTPIPTNGAGAVNFGSPPVTLGGLTGTEPEPEPDRCTTARQEGVTFCETSGRTLEYCMPAAAPVPPEGGAAGMAGAASTDAGAPAQAAECARYETPPSWVYDLLIACVAHCGVELRTSERQLEGSCCYLAESVYYGR